MKLIFDKTILLRGISIAMRAVSSKSMLPILKCILLDATGDKIYMFASDPEISVRTEVEGQIAEKGMIALDASIFSNIVKKLPDTDMVIISTDENLTATLSCGKTKFSIPGFDGSEFPPIPEAGNGGRVTLSQIVLKQLIRGTIFSLDMQNVNRMMTGELFSVTASGIGLVALDGHRIAIRQCLVDASTYQATKQVIPGKTLNEISKILSDNYEDPVDISFSNSHALFELNDTEVYSRLIDGQYFAIERMFGRDPDIKVTVNKKDFRESLERAELLLREGDSKPVILDITDDSMNISMNTNAGNMSDGIPVEKEGTDIRIGFNPRFLLETLKAIDDEMITMQMTDFKSPCIIRKEDGSYIYLILPVSI